MFQNKITTMRIFLTIISITIYWSLSAQIQIPQDTIPHVIQFSIINNTDRTLTVDYQEEDLPQRIKTFKIEFNDADLIVTSSLEKIKNKRKYNYITRLNIAPISQTPLVKNNNELDRQQWALKKKQIGDKVIWKNIAEGQIYPNSQYLLTYEVIKNKKFGFDCEHPPTFKFKQKWPYLVGATSGLGAIIISQVVRNNAIIDRDSALIYKDLYEEAWRSGKTLNQAEDFLESNNNSFEKAKDKNKNQKNLFWIGSSIIAASAIGYLTHWRIYKNNNQLYLDNKDQCEKQSAYLDINPIFNYNPQNDNNQIGLALTYTF